MFPDVVAAVATYLREELAARGFTVTVATEVPHVRPTQLVRLVRTGGPRHDDPGIPTERAQITVECWADTEALAHDLAQVSRALVGALAGVVEGVMFYKVDEVAGPGHLPDPLSDQPRYIFTVLLTVRGEAEAGS